jgi:signal transduction histidine kinase
MASPTKPRTARRRVPKPRAGPARVGALTGSGRVVAGTGRQEAIERAKLEWEGTADALAALVCLLGSTGKVIRANRVVEDWSMGTVAGVIGADPHALIHPDCNCRRCSLAVFMRESLARVRHGTSRQFEHREAVGARFLQLVIRPLRRRRGTGVGRGDPRAVLVVSDQSALHRAQDALQRLNADLETRVRLRTQDLADANRDLRNEISRREQAETALRTSRNELQALSEQLIGAQEGERKRIAVELHDSVGQSLSAVKYTLERGVLMLRGPRRADAAAVFDLAVHRIQEAAESIRAISTNLRPRVLDELGAASAVQWFCRDFAQTYPALEIVTEVKVDDGHVPDRLATVVYRALQELLNNVAKHAKARRVLVGLSLEDNVLMLQVRDNGIGLESASAESRRRGSGLRNLRERAQMTGGEFSVTRAPGRGTLAQLNWRLDKAEKRSASD